MTKTLLALAGLMSLAGCSSPGLAKFDAGDTAVEVQAPIGRAGGDFEDSHEPAFRGSEVDAEDEPVFGLWLRLKR